MDRSDCDDSFFADLEKVAKALCVVTDQTSADELRRLFETVQSDGHESPSIQNRTLTRSPDRKA